MVQRQPGRPTEDEFIGAARRFLADEYEPEIIHLSVGFYTNVIQVYPGKKADDEIIRREYEAEGRAGIEVSLRDFALQQLTSYQKLRNN